MDDNILHLRLVDSLRKNRQILEHILVGVSQEKATVLRDGCDGWTILEVLCHLHDYDVIFLERGQMMLANEHPTFPVYDHLAMVIDRTYNDQPLGAVLTALQQSREQFVAFFAGLSEAEWARTGNHVEHGRYNLESLAAHVSWHDANHIEQITRIMAEASA